MVDVPPRGEGNGKPERSENQLPGSGGTNRRWGRRWNRLKIVELPQISRRGRLLFSVVILHFFTQEAAALAGIPGHVLLLAEVPRNERPVERKRENNDAIAEAGQCE